MEPIILEKISFDPPVKGVLQRLHAKSGQSNEELILSLLKEARERGNPKAIYALAGIDNKDNDGVLLDGIYIQSKVMRVNLDNVNRVFPYIATCGQELYEWRLSKDDLLENYYADEICQIALRTAQQTLLDQLKDTYQLGKTSSMNPGSIEDWPISGQRKLFELLGDPERAIGVKLLDSMLMIPNRTVSGIRFVSDSDYSNCELCPRENCAHRDAPYNPDLLQKKYR
jgi:hypothetical protein